MKGTKLCTPFVTSLLVAAWLLVACGPGAVSTSTQPPEKGSTAAVQATAPPAAAAGETQGRRWLISIGTGTSGGAFFIVGAAMATVLEKSIPGLTVTAESTQASTENARRLGRNELALGLVASDVAYNAYRGEREFAQDGRKYDNLRLVLRGYSSPLQMFALATSNISSLDEIKGKRVIVLTGATVQAHFPLALRAFGITNKDYQESVGDTNAVVDAVSDGHADVGVISGGAPTAAITDLCTRRDVRFLPIPLDKARQINKDNPWFIPGVIKAGVYRGVTQDVPTVQVPINLLAREDLDTDLVYNITKALSAHNDDLKAIYGLAAEFTPERTTEGAPIVPYHPGAEKYFKEKGLLK